MSSNLTEVKKLLLQAVKNGNLQEVVKIINLHGLSFCADLFDGYVLLWEALQCRQFQVAYFLLRKGAKVKGESDSSPLHLAVEERNLVLVESLLKYGAEINCSRLRDKYTPLHIACYSGDCEVISLLLKSGANPNCKASDNCTPLHIAAYEGKFESVESLLQYEVDVDCTRLPDKYTPLHIACKEGWSDSVNELLKSGANANAKAGDGTTPLHLAVQKSFLKIVESLLKHGAQPNCSRLADKYTPLHIACEKKAIKCVGVLLKSGADANVKASNNATPLHLVSLTGHLGLIQSLLKHGVQVNCQRLPDYYTPLHIACEKGHTSVVNLLLGHGADPNILANDNIMPVHLAVKKKCLESVKSLIQHGTKLNFSRRKFDFTPLHLACMDVNGHEMVEVLLKSGADPNIKSFSNETPLYLALEKRHWNFALRVAKLLVEYGGKVNCFRSVDNYTPLHVACEKQNDGVVNILLNSGANTNFRAANSRTPLHLAVERGHFGIVQSLLSKPETEVNSPRLPSNYTPLRIACAKNCSEIVDLLLSHDADPNVKARDSSTPLHFAAMKGYWHIAQKLLNHFADVNAETRKGSSPLNLALKGRSKKGVVETLIKHLIKLNVARLYVSKKNLHLLQLHSGEFLNFELECEEEVKRMKCKHVAGQVTIYEVLRNRQKPVYAKNDSLMQLLKSSSYEEFPNYQSLLLSCVKKSKRRIELLTSGEKWLSVILKTSNILNGKRFRNLPVELLAEIVSYLNDEELRSLSACGENLKRLLCNACFLFS